MNSYFKRDKIFGINSENKNIETLRKFFNCDLKKTGNYDVFDFECGDTQVELKTRKNCKTKYPTTMICLNKVIKAEKDNIKSYFCFAFTDKLCYIKYDKEKFDKYEQREGGRSDRGMIESSIYVYIPIEDLLDVVV